MANTVYDVYSFFATGSSASAPVGFLGRTTPDRESDIVNVKDWGALGDNSHDDTTNIQSAIDYVAGQGGGKVFFPPGTYKISSTIAVGWTSDVGIQLIGSGKHCCIILGGAVSAGGRAFDALERIEGFNVPSGITVTRAVAAIVGCTSSFYDTSAGNGASVYDCWAAGGASLPANSTTPVAAPGSVAFLFGSGTTAVNCRTVGSYEIVFAVSGNGVSLIGCSAENNLTAIRLGWNGAEALASGCSVINFQTEATDTALDLYYCEGCLISGNIFTSSVGPATPAAISNMVWAAGTVTVTTTLPHNLAVGTYPLQLYNISPAGYYDDPTEGWITATRTGASTFTYPLAVDPGAAFVSGFWTYPPRYGIRCRKVYETTIQGNNLTTFCVSGSVDLDYGGAAQHRNNTFICSQTPFGWVIPSDKRNLSGWQFILAGSGSVSTAPPSFNSTPNPFGQMVFADLPGQSGVFQDGPFETQEYDIIDGCKSLGPEVPAGFAEIVIGGGTGHYRVRYDGTDWRRIG